MEERPNLTVAHSPILSVVVPVYNSTAFLEKCLEALENSRFEDFEVIVVDDGSTEPVEAVPAKHGFTYLRLEGPNGPAFARNRGVEIAGGEFIAFVDADVCVSPDALGGFVEVLSSSDKPAAVVGCYDDSPAERNFFSQYKNLFHHYVHATNNGPIETFWTGCGAIRRDVLTKFGGFDELRYRKPAIEDIDLGTRITAAGHRILLDGRITGKHLKRWTFWRMLKSDVFERGVPWTRLMLREKVRARTLNLRPRNLVSVALIYALILAVVAGFFRAPAFAAGAAIAVMLIVLNFDFYRFFYRRHGLWFAIRAIPPHWFYLVYCGFSAVWGTLLHHFEGGGESRARVEG